MEIYSAEHRESRCNQLKLGHPLRAVPRARRRLLSQNLEASEVQRMWTPVLLVKYMALSLSLDLNIIRKDNKRRFASPKSSFQPPETQHPLRRVVIQSSFCNEPRRKTK